MKYKKERSRVMKTPTNNERLKELSQQVSRLKIAIFVLVGFAVFQTIVIWGIQDGLWTAMDANFEVMQSYHN